MKHLKPLTSLRFFAAFVVVLCHLRYNFDPNSTRWHHHFPAWAWNFTTNGFVGVNLFFVLSGFVIAYNYGEKFLERTSSFRKFMTARFARIWPAFVTALVLAIPVYVLGDKEAMAKFPLMLPVHLLLIHNWFPNLGASWLFQSWTIGTEWGFYLMFPLFAAAVFKLGKRGLWTLLLLSAALTFVAPYLYHSGALAGLAPGAKDGVSGEDFVGRVLRWYSFFRLPEFMVGVCVCRLYMLQDDGERDKWSKALGPVALASLVAIVWLMVLNPLPLMFMNQCVLTLPFAAIIWYLAYDRGRVSKWMAWPFLVLLGEASYSLYLIHPIVKQVIYRGVGRTFDLPGDSYPLNIAVIVVAIWASVVIFKKIERPSRRWILERFGEKKIVVATPASVGSEAQPEPVGTSG